MDFLDQLLRAIAFAPALVNGIESLFASKPGPEKKSAAMSFLESAMETVDAVGAREIVDQEKFHAGIGMVVDGVVQCLNASALAKDRGQGATAGE